MFPDTLSMHVMRGLSVTRRIRQNVEKELQDEIPLFFCDVSFFNEFRRFRMMNLELAKDFKNAGFKGYDMKPMPLEYFTNLSDYDFHLVPDLFLDERIDINKRKKLIVLGQLMTCNVQNNPKKEVAFLQGCIAPDDGAVLVRDVLQFIVEYKSSLKSLFRLVKSRFGGDALLFFRCMAQDLDDYVIRSSADYTWMIECIEPMDMSSNKKLDAKMEEFKTSPLYQRTRDFMKHVHDEVLTPPAPNVLTKTVQ